MKLRNKKTGEVDDFVFEVITNRIDLYRRVGSSDTKNIWKYNSLAELNAEWEDYKPAEPLIKDEKIRKAVRAWAEANGFNADYYEFNIKTLPAGTRFSVGHYDIEFNGFFIYDLQTENSYTLAELCGEEEE